MELALVAHHQPHTGIVVCEERPELGFANPGRFVDADQRRLDVLADEGLRSTKEGSHGDMDLRHDVVAKEPGQLPELIEVLLGLQRGPLRGSEQQWLAAVHLGRLTTGSRWLSSKSSLMSMFSRPSLKSSSSSGTDLRVATVMCLILVEKRPLVLSHCLGPSPGQRKTPRRDVLQQGWQELDLVPLASTGLKSGSRPSGFR
jgi:hypothetical protein